MRELRYTLVSDGPSDDALIPILSWLLHEHGTLPIIPSWADFRRLTRPPKKLAARILHALESYPCDLLFVHRDAENQSANWRRNEIDEALAIIGTSPAPIVGHVIPIRMTEAWLLFDEGALRSAAGNPNGKVILNLPKIVDLENVPDPKQILHEQLRVASELRHRRLKSFSAREKSRRVAEYIEDFAPLRVLSAFKTLETEIIELLNKLG
jgi:hypothetical protein